VQWVGEDFREPDQPRLDASDEEQLNRAEHHRRDADGQPHQGDVVHELRHVRVGLERAEERGKPYQEERRQRPDCQQHCFPPQVVADLDRFLVLVRGLVDDVVVFWFEEEVADLPRWHREHPADHRGGRGRFEQHGVRAEKADGAHEVQRLIDPAVVVVAVVVPALSGELLQKRHGPPSLGQTTGT